MERLTRKSVIYEYREKCQKINELTDPLFMNDYETINSILNQYEYNEEKAVVDIEKYLGLEKEIDYQEEINQQIMIYSKDRSNSDYLFEGILIKGNENRFYRGFFEYFEVLARSYDKKISYKLKQISSKALEIGIGDLYEVFLNCVLTYSQNEQERDFMRFLNKSIRNFYIDIIRQAKSDYYQRIISIISLDEEKNQNKGYRYDTYLKDDLDFKLIDRYFTERQKRIIYYLSMNYKQADLVEILGTTKGTISKDLKKIRVILDKNGLEIGDLTNTIKDKDMTVQGGKLIIKEVSEEQERQEMHVKQRNMIIKRYNKHFKEDMIEELRLSDKNFFEVA